MKLKELNIDNTWTLFLDRDGVINHRIMGGYVKTCAEFEFMPKVPEAINILSSIFNRTLVVTNQQGIGKNLMTTEDLNIVHKKMKDTIENFGGFIDNIYFCPDLHTQSNNCRKPKSTMGLQAQKDFPEIDFSKSIMCGDTLSDMEFGRNCKMFTVLIGKTTPEEDQQNLVDFHFEDLQQFTQLLQQSI